MSTKILVDSSVWVDALYDKDLPHVFAFKKYLINEQVCSCPPVVQEVLQGIRNDARYDEVRENFLSLEIFTAEPLLTAIEAADLYRLLRKKGVTIRKPNDCLIAWYAISNKIKLLHNDSDFDLIAEHTELDVVKLN